MSEGILQRLMRGVRVNEETGCWEWQKYRQVPPNLPYGRITVAKRSRMAHRVMYEMKVGAIPKGLCVLHRCDNPPCCNPDHLFLGTKTENIADRDAKGRTARGEKHGRRTKPERTARGSRNGSCTHPGIRKGERNGRAKLTVAEVDEIKRRYAAGGTSLRRLAGEFGVNFTSISLIVRGKTWQSPKRTLPI